MDKVCIECNKTKKISETKIYRSKYDKSPIWKKKLSLKDKIYNIILENDFKNIKVQHEKNWNTKIEINLGLKFKNRYVLYFAAKPKQRVPYNYISSKEAYGNYSNGGVAKFNDKGIAKFYINCPQNYKEKKVWYPHVHFLVSNKNNNKWINELYTKIVLCNIDKKQLRINMKSGNYLLLNALPYEYYIKDHIPGSFSLPYNILKKLSKEEIIKYIREILIHYPNLDKLVKKKTLDIKNIPIIVYCYHSKCGTGMLLIKYLWNLGFKNIKHYKGGIKDWLN